MKESEPVLSRKEVVRSNYNKMSKYYDILAGLSEKKYKEAGLKFLNVQQDETVLEIGFGTGHSIVKIAEKTGDSGKVLGIDLSEGMFNITSKRVMTAGVSDRVELHCGDAEKLPFPDNSVNAVFMSFTLELFDSREIFRVLEECRRVLKKGGRIALVSLSKEEQDTLMVRLYEWAHKKFPGTIDCRPIYVQQSLMSSGFTISKEKKMFMWGLSVEIVLSKKV